MNRSCLQQARAGTGCKAHGGAEAPLILGEFLPYRLAVVQEKVSARFAERYEKRFGLSIREWQVMAVTAGVAARSTQEAIERTTMRRVFLRPPTAWQAKNGYVF